MNNLFTCPDCQHEVSKTAKVCPNCGNKNLKKQIAKKQWSEMDPKKKKLVYIVIGIFFLIIIIGDYIREPEYKNGIGTITHYTGKDWDKNAMLRKMGEEVLIFCKDHPEAKKINLVIVDECRDLKGNVEEISQTISFDRKSIKEFLKYQTVSSFNKNCYEFGIGMLKWVPCSRQVKKFEENNTANKKSTTAEPTIIKQSHLNQNQGITSGKDSKSPEIKVEENVVKYNYEGTIDKYPIRAFINWGEGYHKEGTGELIIPVTGYYYYIKTGIPIEFDGRAYGGNIVHLVARTSGGFEEIDYEESETGVINGTWRKNNKELLINLHSID